MTKIVKFAIVGVLNTAINYIVYCALCYFAVHHLIALGVGYIVAMANSYVLNKLWTFEDKTKASASQFSKFVLINVITYFINALVLELLVRCGINVYLAQALATFVTLFFNFILYNSLIFKNNNSEKTI